MDFTDVTESLSKSEKKRYLDSDFRLLRVDCSNLDKFSFLNLLDRMFKEDLNGRHILLEGHFLYFKPDSWGHKRDGLRVITEGWRSGEPAVICDYFRKAYFPFNIDLALLESNQLLSLSFQSVLFRGLNYQL
ncbi:MAG: hypothetical protein KC589_10945, partial [Nanoarchaeota archaeon]|nr:hypothetical protein [Nanoarchaeota archaeon]